MSTEQPPTFTHLDDAGHARMVDVTLKQPTVRSATARGFVRCAPEVVAALRDGSVPKGDVLGVARIAGIQAAKRTPELLPLAHVIGVHGAAVDLAIDDDGVAIEATVRTADRTGVEMGERRGLFGAHEISMTSTRSPGATASTSAGTTA
jgi:cyclic pyranopterin phosphate synthase